MENIIEISGKTNHIPDAGHNFFSIFPDIF